MRERERKEWVGGDYVYMYMWGVLKIKDKIKRVNRIKKKGKGEEGRWRRREVKNTVTPPHLIAVSVL